MKTRIAALIGSVIIAALVLPAQASASGFPLTRCTFTPTPDNPAARPVLRPVPIAPTVGTFDVTFHFNYGPVTVRLNRAGAAPCAVQNLISLVAQRFYESVLGYTFPDETDGTETYGRGTIAMGNQGPGTNGSEWFIVHSFAHIPTNYSVMGSVIRGMDVLDRIVAAGIIPSDRGPRDGAPAQPVKILRGTLG